MFNTPDFWRRRSGLAQCLLPAAMLYQVGYRLRRILAKPIPRTAQLLCIGNLVAGGAGKTPVALDIGAYVKKQGINACYLSKGYGGQLKTATRVDTERHSAHEVGDEALLLARTLPTIIAHDRAEGVKLAEREGFALIITDDGFQNPRLQPDMGIVVADAVYGFGNGYTLPAGPLREPVAYGLRRANALVVLRRDRKKDNNLFTDAPCPVISADLRTSCPEDALNRKLIAFSGIARPEQFFEALVQHCGLHLVTSHAFRDHHPFSDRELQRLRKEAEHHDATLITTAKDAVRLPADFRKEVLVAEATLNWHNPEAMHHLLAPLLASRKAAYGTD